MALGTSAMLNENKPKMLTEQKCPFVTLPRNVSEEQISSAQKIRNSNAVPLEKTKWNILQISPDNSRAKGHPCPSGAGGDRWDQQAAGVAAGLSPVWQTLILKADVWLCGACEEVSDGEGWKKTRQLSQSQAESFLIGGLCLLWLQTTFWKQVVTPWSETIHLISSSALRFIDVYFLMLVQVLMRSLSCIHQGLSLLRSFLLSWVSHL